MLVRMQIIVRRFFYKRKISFEPKCYKIGQPGEIQGLPIFYQAILLPGISVQYSDAFLVQQAEVSMSEAGN